MKHAILTSLEIDKIIECDLGSRFFIDMLYTPLSHKQIKAKLNIKN